MHGLPVWHLQRIPETGLLVERRVGSEILLAEPLRKRRRHVREVGDLLIFSRYGDLTAGEQNVDGANDSLDVVSSEIGLRSSRFLQPQGLPVTVTSSCGVQIEPPAQVILTEAGRMLMLRGQNLNQPARHVEPFWHGGEGGSERSERDAQAHHAADAVRVTEDEIVGCHRSEILAHNECLHLK